MEPTSSSIRKHILGIEPMKAGDSPQSLRHLKRMLGGPSYRTVRTYQLLEEGTWEELGVDRIKKSAEHVIAAINYELKYVNYAYKRLRPKAKRCVGIPVPKNIIEQVLETPQGVIECHGSLPTTIGQVSRFSIAWWTNADNYKYIRLFGDRIHLNFAQPTVPRLTAFGHHPYHIVFQADDPYHCLKCRKNLEIGQGIWENNSFMCVDCKYEQDTGLRQGINKLRKKRTR